MRSANLTSISSLMEPGHTVDEIIAEPALGELSGLLLLLVHLWVEGGRVGVLQVHRVALRAGSIARLLRRVHMRGGRQGRIGHGREGRAGRGWVLGG